MALEIKIASPTAEGFVQEIKWNYEEIATEVEKKIGHYKTLVYNEKQVSEAKEDRANLNKFIAALKAKDKEIKDMCLAPYQEFHKQMEEIIALVEEPVRIIDGQVKGFEERDKRIKREEIERIYKEKGFAPWTTLESIWNPRWLNNTYSLKQIGADMTTIQHKIGEDILTINQLRDGSQAALSEYQRSMDLNAAIVAATRYAEAKKAEEESLEDVEPVTVSPAVVVPEPVEVREKAFKVFVTKDQLMALNKCFRDNGITVKELKKGEYK